ncbi:hypothetical protein TSUD_357700 [Trifolium subterraneum]|uniref:Uncharacterized protein n=1 Tax=Trifolium subterraneum TaxID=3900 RepID=A0A2Z6M8H8_TRISU|nr:hypothetical protein TSUD_357700 [Trifolium subterraneum]
MERNYELDVQRFGPDRPVKKTTMDLPDKAKQLLKPIICVFQISIVSACVYFTGLSFLTT